MSTSLQRLLLGFSLCTFFLLFVGFVTPARAESYRIVVDAQPRRLIFGADNHATITVRVFDKNGAVVPDGTPVYLNTTFGTLQAVTFYTQHGQVSTLLDNTVGPGKAYINVTVGDSQQTLMVEYLGPNGVAGPQTAPIRPRYNLKAQQIYYSADRRIFDLRDNVEFITSTYTVTADAIQFNVITNILTAQGGVQVTAGDKRISAAKLRLEVAANRGAVVVVNPSIAYFSFQPPNLTLLEDRAAKDTDYTPLNPLPTRTWILCKPDLPRPPIVDTPMRPYADYSTYKATHFVDGGVGPHGRPLVIKQRALFQVLIFPNDVIMFRRPTFYLNEYDHPLFSLPYHVIDLRTQKPGTFFNSELTLASDAGLNVDFPIYYAANADRTGALHIRHITAGSPYYHGTAGVEFDIAEEYRVGLQGDGGFYFDDLARPTRSFSWDQNSIAGKTQLAMNAAYSKYTEETPYTSRAGVNVSRMIGQVNVNARTNLNKFENQLNSNSEFFLAPPALPLWKTGLALSFSPYIGYDHTVAGATATQTASTTTNLYEGLGSALGFPVWYIGGGTLAANLSNDLSREGSGTLTDNIDASLSYRRTVFKSFSTSYMYSYNLMHTFNSSAAVAPPNQRLSMDISGGKPQHWTIYGYSAYSLTDKSLYSSANFTYFPKWNRARDGSPRWTIQTGTFQTSGNGAQSTLNTLVSISRSFNLYSVVLHYSPTGNVGVPGIGTGNGKTWSIEVMRQGW